jgi:hypothetical protein
MKVAVFFRVRKPLFMRSLVSLVDFFMLVMMFLMVELVLPVRRIIVVIVSHGSSERSDEEQCSGDAQYLIHGDLPWFAVFKRWDAFAAEEWADLGGAVARRATTIAGRDAPSEMIREGLV